MPAEPTSRGNPWKVAALTICVAYDADSAGRLVGRARLADDVARLRVIGATLDAGNDLMRRWATAHGGAAVEVGGDEGLLEVGPSALQDVESARKQYAEMVGCTLSVGLGRKPSEASKALLAAKFRGKNRVVLYDKSVEDEVAQAAARQPTTEQKEAEAYLGKADAGPATSDAGRAAPMTDAPDHSEQEVAAEEADHPAPERTHSSADAEAMFRQHADTAERKDRAHQVRESGRLDDIRSKVAETLEAARRQLPVLGQIKLAYPEAYAAVTGLIQGVVDLGRELKGADQALAKAERGPVIYPVAGGMPSTDHPSRPAWEQAYLDRVVARFANGDRSAVQAGTIPAAEVDVGDQAWTGVEPSDLPRAVVCQVDGGYRLLGGAGAAGAARAAGAEELPVYMVKTWQDPGSSEVRDPLEEIEADPVKGFGPRGLLDKAALPGYAPLPVGTLKDAKLKVRHWDGRTSWKGVESGLIASQDPHGFGGGSGANTHATSSREPGAR
jgi:hypothetical protein